MQAKHLIIIAIVGILGLVAFNWSMSRKVAAAQSTTTTASTPVAVTNDSSTLGNQPKATLDKANAQINQANADANQKMAEAEQQAQ